jgi:hypothetical protein
MRAVETPPDVAAEGTGPLVVPGLLARVFIVVRIEFAVTHHHAHATMRALVVGADMQISMAYRSLPAA